jgi:hypothetical protein
LSNYIFAEAPALGGAATGRLKELTIPTLLSF